MQKYYKQCQSCGMHLKNGELSGTEEDGAKCLKYCHYCYKEGKFTQPDITMEEMKAINDKALKEKGWIKPLRWLSHMQLPKLERWKK